MNRILYAAALFLITSICFSGPGFAAELLGHPEKIVGMRDDSIPQAPRVSPDGTRLVFEYYTKQSCQLWLEDLRDGKQRCLTCEPPPGRTDPSWLLLKFENGYWHPSSNYLLFNSIATGDQGIVHVGRLAAGRFVKVADITSGTRAQFSRPNGNVIFFQNKGDLSYRILGPNPMRPYESMNVSLRGPIADVNAEVEVSHPSLAPDGSTILFAARTGSISLVKIDDVDRQRLFKVWQGLVGVPLDKVNQELQKFYPALAEHTQNPPETISVDTGPEIFSKPGYEQLLNDRALIHQQVLAKDCTRKDLLMLWIFGFLNKLDLKYESEVQQLIYSRIWTTDVFGAPIEPLVKDLSSAPLPQKWPTVSRDGSFAVFEAGHWKNRHIYLVAKKDGKWMDSAIKLTEKGSYNSSPEIDPNGEWLYFESNRDKTKGIWRAKLDWPAINKQLGL